uniref:Coiled-coil domain-containing protein 22 n=1 Tax=Oncorhynchus mykiss TaxID=8022 RepID=A0A8C7QYM5_ONCMY
MDEVDKILIHSLRQTGTDVGKDVQSVKHFTSELIVEAVVRCLRVIDPALGSGLCPSLPPGMSARFRVGMSLAQACQDLGYKGEIGYQTFLYSNEPEIRSLLMFLVEKLPRESAEASDQPAGKSALLQKSIAAQIKAQLALPWLSPSCRLPLLCKTQNPGPSHSFHSQTLSLPHCLKVPGKRQLKEENDYHRDFLPPVTAQPSQHASVPASLLEQHAGELSAAQEWENEWNSQGLLSRLTPEEYRSRKRARLQKRIEEQLRTAAQTRPDTLGAHGSGSDLTELLQSFGGSPLIGDILAKGTRFTHTEKFTFTEEPEKAAKQMAAAANSLPSSHQSEEDLQARQQEELASLQQQLQQLSLSLEEVGGDMRQLTVSIHQVIGASIIQNRQTVYLRRPRTRFWEIGFVLQITEFENLPKDISRSAYTARILEIVGNIRKQKEEITKILSDTKELQKEINSLTGKLDRTFAVTDELVFKDAKKDESVRKSYKYLAALHENCTQLIQTIEDTGTIMREIRDLEEQIETENGKKTVSNLEKILEDYKAIRQENSALAAKIREA